MITNTPLIFQRLIPLQELAPFKSKFDLMVAGFHRACPSTTLDKKFIAIYFLFNNFIVIKNNNLSPKIQALF